MGAVPLTMMVALVGIAGCGGGPNADDGMQPITSAVVERVIDGDTIDLVFSSAGHDDTIERVRLIGIDTPESVSPNVPRQCYGSEASAALFDLLPVGTVVTVTRDVEARDRYDRLLLYLHRDDGLFVNRWLIEEGFADAVHYEPNTAFRTDFNRVRDGAVAQHRGLWGSCDGPDQPVD